MYDHMMFIRSSFGPKSSESASAFVWVFDVKTLLLAAWGVARCSLFRINIEYAWGIHVYTSSLSTTLSRGSAGASGPGYSLPGFPGLFHIGKREQRVFAPIFIEVFIEAWLRITCLPAYRAGVVQFEIYGIYGGAFSLQAER